MNLEYLQSIFEEVVKKCIQPGACLQISGGLDSALIQSVAQLDSLYCATWPDEDNLTDAKKAAMGHVVTPVTFEYQEMLDVLPRIAKLTNGRGTWSQVCQWFLCQRAAKDGCTSVVTGEGADELFGGYSRYRVLYWLDRIYQDPLLVNYRGITDFMLGDRNKLVSKMLSRTASAYDMSKWPSMATDETESLVSHCMRVETNRTLPELLVFGEAMAKDHGLECLFPFMDKEMQCVSAQLKDNEKVDHLLNKVVLRQLAQRLGVHLDIVAETTKKGLFVPQSWAPVGQFPKWSRSWFIGLMEEAYASTRGGSDVSCTMTKSEDGGAPM